jgi:hypothetical protein
MDLPRPASPTEHAPFSLWGIALLALAPFPFAAGVYAYGPVADAPEALRVLLTWSMVVLAFLGGVRWGLETARPKPRWSRLAGSIVSPGGAWAFYMLRGHLGVPSVFGVFLVAFMLQWLFDHRTPNMPARYPRLSTVLTGAACVSLAVALEKALNA